ncbi:FCH domain-containing protein [Echinococcus granulosus]|uniref:FCH domain-containing protein n=1 Tax=Echinococcus granulosus TaxID=6210 RepID=W6UK89_ECHGR|nr:FCH domain-containing protein [Echinococcus granulosus]EUB61473.1 FCH domain-containing protein [Echinococcus granulosus]
MSVDGLFSHAFWGEKNMGFESLSQNMKSTFKNTSEFCDFLRDVNTIEENYAKALCKLSKQAASYGSAGGLKLWWSLFSSFLEQSISLRSNLESERLTIWRDVQKYLEELQKKQRNLKENETGTQEVVHSFQVATTHLQKAKELYHTRYKEYERIRLNETHSARDVEKAETKLKKAQDEYKYSVEKYNNLRLQFVDKMRLSCSHFEDMEVTHLTRMCEFFGRFSEALVQSRSADLSLATDFNQQRSLELTPNHLLFNMIEERGTGCLEPLPAEFEDVEVAAAFPNTTAEAGGGGIIDAGLTSQSSTPCPSCLTSDLNSLRAASALPAFGSQESPVTSHQSPLDPSWQSSLSEINGTHSNGLGRRAGAIFQRRNRQNSAGLEGDTKGAREDQYIVQYAACTSLAVKRPPNVDLDGVQSNSPCEKTSKVVQPSTSTCPKVDDDGYNIRPANPWASEHSRPPSSSSNSSSGSSSPSEKTFKGLKALRSTLLTGEPCGDVSATHPPLNDSPPKSEQLNHLILGDYTENLTGCFFSFATDRSRAPSSMDIRRYEGSNQEEDVSPPYFNVVLGVPDSHHFCTIHRNNSNNVRFRVVLGTASMQCSVDGSPKEVNIRPFGDLSPGATELTLPTSTPLTPLRSLTSFSARDFRRPHTSADKPFVSISSATSGIADVAGGGVMGTRSISVAKAPLVPILPPPPGQDTISSRRGDESSKAPAITDKGNEESFNPFGLLKHDEGTPTPKVVGSWEDTFKTPDDTNETYDRLIDLRDNGDEVGTASKPSHVASAGAKVCHAPLAAVEDDDTSTPPPPTPPQTLQILRFSTEPRALPPPIPPLPIAIALTETWRAQFPNGGGSSFTTTERPAQSLFGQVTLAVAREDLRLLIHSQKWSLKPLILIFSRAQRMNNVQAPFSGVSIQLESGEGVGQYQVKIPGDLLYHYLVETQSKAADENEEEYTRLCLLEYSVEATGLPPPITMCTFWRCEKGTTDFRLDYFVQWPKWSSSSSLTSSRNAEANISEISCQDLRVNLLVDGGVARMQSRPLGTWNVEQTRASWSIPLTTGDAHQQQHPGVDVSGNIRAKFFLTRGPGTPQPVALQFCRDGGCLPSGVVLSLGAESLPGGTGRGGGGYRLTMCKYRLLGDRYFCDPPVPIGVMTQRLPILSPPNSKAQTSG